MARGGRAKQADEGERRCIATGQSAPRSGLIRFVVGPDGAVVPDVLEKLPGRGLWVAADRAALDTAVARNAFSRAARAPVTVPDGLAALVEARLAERLIGLIAIARKSGAAVVGFEKVKDWLAKDAVEILFQASDGSQRGKSKLRPPRGKDCFFEVLSASELGLSFGRENVIHAALAASGLVDAIRRDATRLSGVRTNGGGDTGKVK